jgi:hypothetical protein
MLVQWLRGSFKQWMHNTMPLTYSDIQLGLSDRSDYLKKFLVHYSHGVIDQA